MASEIFSHGAAAGVAEERRGVVRAAGVEPARAFRPYGFSYHFGFRRLASIPGRVRGLDYPFALARRL